MAVIEKMIEAMRCPFFMNLMMAVIAAAALAIALMAQYVFDLQPCILCLIQRYPYGVVIGLGILGVFLSKKSAKFGGASLILIGFAFLVNSVIAFYHTGVEQKWWPSHLEGCAVPNLGADPGNILETLHNSKAVRCDEIPWSDPILNLSMANYNIVFCLGLGLIALYSAVIIFRAKAKS